MGHPDASATVAPTPARLRRAARFGRPLTWPLWAIAAGQAALSLLLAALNHLGPMQLVAEYVVPLTAAGLAFTAVGTLIVSRRPEHLVGWLLCAAGVGSGLSLWTGQYARYALVTQPGALPAAEIVAWIVRWAWIPTIAVAVLFLPLVFPDGRLLSARWRPAVWIAAGATLLLSTLLALAPGTVDTTSAGVSNPFAPAGIEPLLRIIEPLTIILTVASLALAVAAPVARFRRAQGSERQRLKWFAYATALLVAAYVTPVFVYGADFHEETFLNALLLSAALPFLPIAVGIAVLRHRLYDIDVIISRTLVYATLTACVIGIYVLIVVGIGAVLRTGDNLLVSLLATGLVAVLFQPLRERLQRGVNRLLYGERDDPYAVLSRLGRRLEETLAPEAVLPTVVRTIREALRVPYAAIALEHDGRLAVAASTGAPVDDPLRVPLAYQQEAAGRSFSPPARRARRSAPPTGACSTTSPARRASPPTPCASPSTCVARASAWSVRAKRSAAASGATSTTASARASPASPCNWPPRATGWRTTRPPPSCSPGSRPRPRRQWPTSGAWSTPSGRPRSTSSASSRPSASTPPATPATSTACA
jgi:hypothetical protein